MKWRLPKSGDRRLVYRFLWWPLVIGYEVRWLEWAMIEQQFEQRDLNGTGRWINAKWHDSKTHGCS